MRNVNVELNRNSYISVSYNKSYESLFGPVK